MTRVRTREEHLELRRWWINAYLRYINKVSVDWPHSVSEEVVRKTLRTTWDDPLFQDPSAPAGTLRQWWREAVKAYILSRFPSGATAHNMMIRKERDIRKKGFAAVPCLNDGCEETYAWPEVDNGLFAGHLDIKHKG